MEPEITVIIVDDDFGSVQRLQDDLSAFSCIRILDTAMTAEIGKKQIIKYHKFLPLFMLTMKYAKFIVVVH